VPDPFTLSGLLLAAIYGIPGGVLANRADALVCRFGKELVASLTDPGVPYNHDALRAMRRAQLDALSFLGNALRDGKAVVTPADIADRDAFLPQLITFLQREQTAANTLALTHDLARALTAAVDAALAAPSSAPGRVRLESLAAKAASCAWDEIRPLHPPRAFENLFEGREPGVPSWFIAYAVLLGQALKKDADFRAMFTADRLANILSETVDLRAAVDRFIADSDQRQGELVTVLARTEAKVDDVKDDTRAIRAGFAEAATAREHDRALLQQILAVVQAEKAAGISPNLAGRLKIEEALTSRDPERRRAGYLARGILNMARATHELVLEWRQLRPAEDEFQRANDTFADSMFEGELLRAERRLDEAIGSFERAVAVRPSDGLAIVSLSNALMDRAMSPASDGSEWNPEGDEWATSLHRAGEMLVPILNTGYSPSNPGFIPAVWAYAQLWFYLAESGVAMTEATLRSTQALITADSVEPNNPITLRLLGRNFHRFTRDPSKTAENYFKRAVDADPADPKQRLYYALFLTESARDGEAATVFEQCLDLGPDDPYVLDAYAFLLSKNPADAVRAEVMWRHALRIAPWHAGSLKHYGKFLASLPGGSPRAERVFLQGLTHRPNDPALWCEYAVLLEEQPGREADAIAAYEEVLARSPNAVEAKVRCTMHKILAGLYPDPAGAGEQLGSEGFARHDERLVIAAGWLGVLYSPDQENALKLLKALAPKFGSQMQFLIQHRNIQQAVADGNRFADWLDPLCRTIAGELPLATLERWDAWVAA
jgi:tetratricopeptide (TPR) repeat protein